MKGEGRLGNDPVGRFSPEGQHPLRGSAGPLHLLIDIEPVSATGSSEPAGGSRSKAKESGLRRVSKQSGDCFPDEGASMAARNAACGAKSTSGSTSKHWGSGRRSSPPKPRRDMSRAETSPGDCFPGDWMHCVKLLGQRLMARDFDRQVAEFQADSRALSDRWLSPAHS